MAADPDFRPWNELFPDALGLIFGKLNNGQEVLGAIPLVCKPWCKVVEGPYWLQTIDLRELYVSCTYDCMLPFIAEHAGSLETLDIGIRYFNVSTFEQFAAELGTLTTLVVRSEMHQHALEAIVKNCKRLVSLSWDQTHGFGILKGGNCSIDENDCFAWSMPNLKHLCLRHAYSIGQSRILRLLSGSPRLEWVEIGGLKLDRTMVKEKYPNIVTLVISGVPVDLDELDDGGWDDFQFEYAFNGSDNYEW